MNAEIVSEEGQIPEVFTKLVNTEMETFDRQRSVIRRNTLPSTNDIPISKPGHWMRVDHVTCLFVDMAGSTRLSASSHEKDTAGVYELFTGSAVRIFHEFDAPYIDVKGDGVFALFNPGEEHRALAAAVTFKTFAEQDIIPAIREKTGVEIGTHAGIDRTTLLVRKVGLKKHNQRTDRQNEVWAGKAVNMASKLAGRSPDNVIYASERFFGTLQYKEALQSCPCSDQVLLWKKQETAADLFDFSYLYELRSIWCKKHGIEYLKRLLCKTSA